MNPQNKLVLLVTEGRSPGKNNVLLQFGTNTAAAIYKFFFLWAKSVVAFWPASFSLKQLKKKSGDGWGRRSRRRKNIP